MAAGFSLLSLGQETDGSLISPASRAALYALKPTVGSVTLAGVISVTSAFDTLGPMARSVDDLAALTEIILDGSAKAGMPRDGFKSSLSGSWAGLRVGFLDPEIWKLPDSLCEPVDSVIAQMVRRLLPEYASAKASGLIFQKETRILRRDREDQWSRSKHNIPYRTSITSMDRDGQHNEYAFVLQWGRFH